MLNIIPFQEKYLPSIAALLQEIDQEFAESIFSPRPNASSKLPKPYWLAVENEVVIGTIGLHEFPQEFGILKSMMLRKSHRGKRLGISQLLLQTALLWAIQHQLPIIYLGTMTQFKAAQKFYQQNGFQQISKEELPANFLHNPVDDVFYYKRLI